MSEPETKICPRCGTHYDLKATFCQIDGERLDGVRPPEDAYVGQVLLEQFRIDAVLGRGGMGTVYRARQLALGRDVALKVLNPDLVRNPEAWKRFQREVRAATSVDHPNVVRVFLFGQLPDGSLYLVMECLDGVSLAQVLERERGLAIARTVHILEQIARGLGAAHAKGVVHRDVKPENVVLVREGHDADFVKLLDFGIARMLEGDSSGVTKTGVIFGTARYMSPEGAQGEATDARSDVYSLGVLAYQMFTGETPFEGATPVALLLQHVNNKAPDIRKTQRGASLPKPIAEVVMRALSKKPAQRPADGVAFADELVRAMQAASTALAKGGREEDDTTPFKREATTGGTEVVGAQAARPFRALRALGWLVAAFAIGAALAFAVAEVNESVAATTTETSTDSAATDASVTATTDAAVAAEPPPAPPAVVTSVRVDPSTVDARHEFAVEVVASPERTGIPVDVKRGDRVVASATATPTGQGTFRATMKVDRGGHYVVEAHVGEMLVSAPLDVNAPRAAPSAPEIFQ